MISGAKNNTIAAKMMTIYTPSLIIHKNLRNSSLFSLKWQAKLPPDLGRSFITDLV
jgi:hypothetical protein